MRRNALSRGLLILSLVLGSVLSHAQSGSERVASTVESKPEQFREYLNLSGIGEEWRATWIAALDSTWQRVAAPYWPQSMEVEMRDAMIKTDIAPSVWSVYHAYYSRQEMDAVNSLLRSKGISGYLASSLGKQFCREWALHEDQGHQEVSRLTFAVLDEVYQRNKPEIKAARADYLRTHPGFKD